MDRVVAFVESHGVPVIFVTVFLSQLGLPIPSVPILLLFGALAGTGRVDPLMALVVALVGCLCADLLWFEIGRWRGSRVLSFLCKLSLEPDSCVSKTEGVFARYGVKSLLVAKFIPGFETVAPPLAGMLGIGTLRFVAWSTAGALVWLVTLGGLGYLLSDRIEELVARAESMGHALALVIGVSFGAYLTWKIVQRQRILASIRTARITADELHELIVGGRSPVLIDARSTEAIQVLPFVIPGALMITLDDLDKRYAEIPREHDVIVYCS